MTVIEDSDSRTQWAGKRGLRRSSANHYCLHWVGKGQCNVAICREDRNRYRWMDHVTGWLRDGKPLLICEPYHVTADDLIDISRVARYWELDIVIHGDGCYGSGTICIELSKSETAAPNGRA